VILIEAMIETFGAAPFPRNAGQWAATILVGLLPDGVGWLVGAGW
jgi:hypothetical protein